MHTPPDPTPESTPDPTPGVPDGRWHVTVVVDRSGSMEGLRGFVHEGVNRLLRDLEPATVVTLVQFDDLDPFDVMVDAIPAAEVTPIPYERYEPRGGTPLFDAVGRAVLRLDRELAADPDAGPTRAVLAIVSDGHENASHEFSGDDVRRLLEEKAAAGWDVQYHGLGNDAFREAERLGVARHKVAALGRTATDTGVAFASIARSDKADRARTRRNRTT